MGTEGADYVIVGGGSAGCVLAARLSEDPRRRVLLIEAGGDDRPLAEPKRFKSNLLIRTPGGFGATLSDRTINWMLACEPDSAGRAHVWPRGRVLGGSSAINGLLWVRGAPADYDGWAAQGAAGWSWAELAPAMARAEAMVRPAIPADRHRVSQALIAACEAAGLPERADAAGSGTAGTGWFPLTVHRGRRQSAATAWLHAALRRPNLRVLTHALATRVRLEAGRAVAVEYDRGGLAGEAPAAAEVILCAGAIGTPGLLERSGLGDGARLAVLGIAVAAHLPGVGGNLQDHYISPLQWRLRPGTPSINTRARGLPLLAELLRYLLRGRGMLAQGAAQAVAWAHSGLPHAAGEAPDLQLLMVPATMDLDALGQRQQWALERLPGLTIAPCQLRPFSRGRVALRSPDPRAAPVITPGYLEDPRDVAALVAGYRLARRIAAQPALAPFVLAETQPGADVTDDRALEACVRAIGSTLYHPVGSARMGAPDDPAAVLDPYLRVRGVIGLRVADASAMPTIPSGNTNAPTLMLAERAAELITRGA